MSGKVKLSPGVKVLDFKLSSIGEWDHWKHSVLFQLRQDSDYKLYTNEAFKFGAKTTLKPLRDLKPSGSGDNAVTAEDKCNIVDMMLQQIAQYCPRIPHNDIVRVCILGRSLAGNPTTS